jgi:hypothetical protein
VQQRQHDLGGTFPGILRVFVDGYATAVVNYSNTPVSHKGHVNASAKASHCFINGVVHDFYQQVMKSGWPG